MNAPSHKPPSCLEMLCQCKPRLRKLEAVAEAAGRLAFHDACRDRRDGVPACHERQALEDALADLEAGQP